MFHQHQQRKSLCVVLRPEGAGHPFVMSAAPRFAEHEPGFIPHGSRDHFFFRKKKFWNAAMASGERIRSPKKRSSWPNLRTRSSVGNFSSFLDIAPATDLYLSYKTARRSISHSYAITGTSSALDS
jgi:hypothetical protein